MMIVSSSELNECKILDFLAESHRIIGRKIDIQNRDKDLLNISEQYWGNDIGFWCLLENEEIVGTIALRIIESSIDKIGEIRRFYVKTTEQNRGLGRFLLDFVINFARKKNYSYLRATTSYDREKIIHMLKERNFYKIASYRNSFADLFFELSLIPHYLEMVNELKDSLMNQEEYFNNTLILNPVENVPTYDIIEPCSSFLHGLYNTDSIRNESEKINSKIQFGGRENITFDVNKIYKEWSKLLGAEAISMRLLSGLHAHIVLFMALTSIGDTVMLLPEKAGGHMSTKSILERLGLNVKELAIDFPNKKIDIARSLQLIGDLDPKIIFIDRSEGLIFEDFSWLSSAKAYKIFDASQYLTNILCKDYTNPFEWGFDMLLSTLHKNLPGPQRAMLCVKEKNVIWEKIRAGISTYVSNMHVFSIYSAGLLLKDVEKLKYISKEMLKNTLLLEKELSDLGISVIKRNISQKEPTTHHLWISCSSKEEAFKNYLDLERIGFLVNYRLLPYNGGYGLRLGLSAATVCGLNILDVPLLAELISSVLKYGYSEDLQYKTRAFILNVKRDCYEK